MKYIDAEKLIAKIKELNLATKTYDEQVAFNNALAMVAEIIDSLQQEQPEMDFEQELYKHFGQVKDFSLGMRIGKYFYELGRKQVLQEIYDGKTKPVDKITAAWLGDKEEDK